MTVSKAQMAATKRFEDKNYDKVLIRLPKGKKAEIQAAAEKQRESLNAYVIGAVEQRMESEGLTGLPANPAVSEIVERDKSGAVKPAQSGAGQKPENDIALPQTAISSNATAEQLIQLTKKRKSGKEDKSE